MKKIAVVLFIFITGLIFAEQETIQTNISTSTSTVYKYKQDGNYYYNTSAWPLYLGRENGKMSKDEETFRLIMRMDLTTIPDSAVITGVIFTYSLFVDSLPQHFTYRLGAFPNNTSGAQNEWNASSSSTIYRSSILTQGLTPSFHYNNNNDTLLINAMERALVSNQFAICLVSDAEGINTKIASCSANPIVTIYYIIPTIKVANNFGGGTVKINGATYASGTELKTKVGRQFTIEASNQNFQGTMKYFERWKVPGNAYTSTNPYTFTISKSEAYIKQIYTAEFGNPINFIVKNNFAGGIIKVDADTVNSGATITRPKNVAITLGSLTQEFVGYQRVWNNYVPVNKSNWQKKIGIADEQNISSAVNPTHNFTVAQSDTNVTYIAAMRKNYRITRNDQTEFDGIFTVADVTRIVEQNSGTVPAPSTKVVGSRNYSFAGWVNGGSGSFIPTDNMTYPHNALYKYPRHTTQATAFANNSQRKFVMAYGSTFTVYESMGKIWLERGGTTIANNGTPLNPSTDAKNPSITYTEQGGNTRLYVTFQEKTVDNNYVIKLMKFDSYGNLVYSRNVYKSSNLYTTNDALPVIAASYGGTPTKDRIMFVWRENAVTDTASGLRHYGVFDEGNTISTSGNIVPDRIPFSQPASTSPALAVVPTHSNSVNYQLVWENLNNIYYQDIIWSASGMHPVYANFKTLSAGGGYTNNRTPALIAVGAENESSARVTWIAERGGNDPTVAAAQLTESSEKTAVLKDPLSDKLWNFGSGVNSVNINISEDLWTLGWGRSNDLPLQFIDSRSFADDAIFSLPINGKDIQISNGDIPGSTFALAFNSNTLPYVINTKLISVQQDIIAATKSREGIVAQADAQVYYSIGDIKVDGEKIDFKEIPDSATINTLQQTNNYLMSNAFQVDDNSEFFYTIKFGVTDPEALELALTNNEYVNFKVELIDANTNELLGVFDEVTYNQQNVAQYNNVAYQINTNGLGSRTVKLRLVITNNIDPYYSISEKLEEAPNAMLKKHYTQTSYKGSLAEKVYTYNLDQNYPNPFNPSTVISYQLAAAGHVTLKIYDLLGREVTTLVNEEKPSGSYTVNFSASQLSTGVYFYELKSGTYRAVKKLMLMK